MTNIKEKTYFSYFLKSISTNFFNFNGRVNKKEFWVSIIYIYASLLILAVITGFAYSEIHILTIPAGVLFLLAYIYMIIPILSLSVRRLHDAGKSGLFVLFIFIFGFIFIIIIGLLNGSKEDNRFGPSTVN